MENEARPIDGNELHAQVKAIKANINSPNRDYQAGYMSALSVVEGLIACMPTIENRAWWIYCFTDMDGRKWWRCSRCDARDMGIDEPGFCRLCGAKMRKGKELEGKNG